MLVHGMSLEELRHEIKEDKPAILHKLVGLAKKTVKHMRKTHMSSFHKSFDYISPRKNNWIVGYTFSEPNIETATVHFLAIMYRPIGFTVFYPPPKSDMLLIYTDHFFKRYNQRLELNLVNPKDKIRHFVLNASEAPYEKMEDIKPGMFSVFARIRQGVMLGVKYSDLKFVKFNTFLSEKDLKGDQIQLAQNLKKQIQKYHDQDII